MTEEQKLLAQLAEIRGQLAVLEEQKKRAATAELEGIAKTINQMVVEAKRKARDAGLYFEYSPGYESFGVYQWEQSDYC